MCIRDSLEDEAPKGEVARALRAYKPERDGRIRGAEGDQQEEPHQRRNHVEGPTAEQGPRGFTRVEHDDERDGQSDPEHFGHAETPSSIVIDWKRI